MYTDADILNALKQDPEQGAKLLFKRYYKPLVFLSESLIHDIYFSEDIVQDLFFSFLKEKFYLKVTPETLSAYLFQSIKNNCFYKNRQKKEFNQAELLQYEVAEEKCSTISPDLIDAIHQAIEQLPERTQAVIQLIIIQEKKYKEAAEILDISVNTVKTLLKNGLKSLRQQFSNTELFLFYLFFSSEKA